MLPPVIIRALLAQEIGEVMLSSMGFDPSEQRTNYWVDGLFQDGANVSCSALWNSGAWGLPSNLDTTYTFGSQKSVDLRTILLPSDLQIEAPSYWDNLSLQFSHTLIPCPVAPGKGIGIYGKLSASRGNPNPIGWSFVGDITRETMFRNRPYDGFGIGLYSYSWRSDLEQTIDPTLPLDAEKGLKGYHKFAVTP